MTNPLKEAIKETIEARKEAVDFFSNTAKQDREKWTVSQFLKNMGINFIETELVPVIDQAPDIIFRDAVFEIKEIDIEGRKRHQEKRDELKKAEAATSLDDLISPYEFKEILFQGAMDKVENLLKGYLYSPDFSKKTDILFYVNYSVLGDLFHVSQHSETWKQWRSVSMVANNSVSHVFWASGDAPAFLRNFVERQKV